MPHLSSKKLQTLIRRLLDLEGSICLWLSGGKDSRLLYEAMRRTTDDFEILRFDDAWTQRQRKAFRNISGIDKYPVYSYQPVARTLMGMDSSSLQLGSAYAIGDGCSVGLVRSLTHDNRCLFDLELPVTLETQAPRIWDIMIVGYRSEDEHGPQTPEWSIGSQHFLAPLYNWTEGEILDALKRLGVTDVMEDGDLHACHECLKQESGDAYCLKEGKGIPRVEFTPIENYKAWKEAHK